jgi:hypothetical protein
MEYYTTAELLYSQIQLTVITVAIAGERRWLSSSSCCLSLACPPFPLSSPSKLQASMGSRASAVTLRLPRTAATASLNDIMVVVGENGKYTILMVDYCRLIKLK